MKKLIVFILIVGVTITGFTGDRLIANVDQFIVATGDGDVGRPHGEGDDV